MGAPEVARGRAVAGKSEGEGNKKTPELLLLRGKVGVPETYA
jgi:hypothetical protein